MELWRADDLGLGRADLGPVMRVFGPSRGPLPDTGLGYPPAYRCRGISRSVRLAAGQVRAAPIIPHAGRAEGRPFRRRIAPGAGGPPRNHDLGEVRRWQAPGALSDLSPFARFERRGEGA